MLFSGGAMGRPRSNAARALRFAVALVLPFPGLGASDQRDADEAAHGDCLAVRSLGHLGRVDVAGVRIEDLAAVPGPVACGLQPPEHQQADDLLVVVRALALA